MIFMSMFSTKGPKIPDLFPPNTIQFDRACVGLQLDNHWEITKPCPALPRSNSLRSHFWWLLQISSHFFIEIHEYGPKASRVAEMYKMFKGQRIQFLQNFNDVVLANIDICSWLSNAFHGFPMFSPFVLKGFQRRYPMLSSPNDGLRTRHAAKLCVRRSRRQSYPANKHRRAPPAVLAKGFPVIYGWWSMEKFWKIRKTSGD